MIRVIPYPVRWNLLNPLTWVDRRGLGAYPKVFLDPGLCSTLSATMCNGGRRKVGEE